MAADVNYDREKLVVINDTPINIGITAAEEPAAATTALSADGSGSTGILNVIFTADADESGGVDVQDLFRVEDLRVIINQATGLTQLAATVIPVLGAATDGTPETILIKHPQTMDAWQTAAGRPRQV